MGIKSNYLCRLTVRLITKDNSPVGGFHFICEDKMRIRTDSNFPRLVRKVFDYLNSNGMNIPVNLEEVIEDQICSRQPFGRCSGDERAIVKNRVVVSDVTKCIFRGIAVREKRCSSCTGRIMAKIFSCQIHGECTLFRKSNLGVQLCYTCPDAKLPDSEIKELTLVN